jgi:hypothetical protein
MKLPGEIGLGSGIVASTQRTRKVFSGGRSHRAGGCDMEQQRVRPILLHTDAHRDVHTRGDLQQLMRVTTQLRRCQRQRTHDAQQSKSFVKVAPSALLLVFLAVESHDSVPIAAKRPLAQT